MEKELAKFVEELKSAGGENLKAVILYGSSVTGEFQPKHSHLDLLCVVENAGVAQIESLQPAVERWLRKGHPEPRVFAQEELRSFADVFAIEFLDMKAHHRVLFGEDVLAGLSVPLRYHKLQVERELQTNWLRLRQALLAAPKKTKAQLGILTASVSSFGVLFRHTLMALGEAPAANKREVIDSVARLAGCDPRGFHTILDFREGKRKEREIDIHETLEGYFRLVERVTREVDRRLDGNA